MLQVTNLHFEKYIVAPPWYSEEQGVGYTYCLTNIWVYSIKRYKSPFRRLLLASL